MTHSALRGLAPWLLAMMMCSMAIPAAAPKDFDKALRSEILPLVLKGTTGTTITIAGAPLGERKGAIAKALSDQAKKVDGGSAKVLVFKGVLRPAGEKVQDAATSAASMVETTTLYFFEDELYKVKLFCESERTKSNDAYQRLRAALAQRYGPPINSDEAAVGTCEGSEWNDLHGKRLNIRAVWEEDDGVAYIEYQYIPVYTKFVQSLLAALSKAGKRAPSP